MKLPLRLLLCAPLLAGSIACADAGAGTARHTADADSGSRARRERRQAAPGEPAEKDVRYWVAGCSVSEDLWRYRKESSTVACDPRGRYLEGDAGELVWPEYLLAEEMDSLTLEGDALDTVRWVLWWSTDDDFAPARSVAATAVRSSPGAVRFDLDRAPDWTGRIRRLRLTWSGRPSPATRVVSAWGRKAGGGPAG